MVTPSASAKLLKIGEVKSAKGLDLFQLFKVEVLAELETKGFSSGRNNIDAIVMGLGQILLDSISYFAWVEAGALWASRSRQ
jgi:hypothetical protein